jgi:hypothetical protein
MNPDTVNYYRTQTKTLIQGIEADLGLNPAGEILMHLMKGLAALDRMWIVADRHAPALAATEAQGAKR